uniref:Uncharacterized protein n=1 Tax=Schistocephalus solidus TaxID=70667 RepID=A0A0X3NQF6_SCHSO
MYTYSLETKTRPCKDSDGELRWVTEEVEKEHEAWKEDKEQMRRGEEEEGPAFGSTAQVPGVESTIVPVPVTRFQELETTNGHPQICPSSMFQCYEPPHRVIERQVKLTRGKDGNFERHETIEIFTRLRAMDLTDHQVLAPSSTGDLTLSEIKTVPWQVPVVSEVQSSVPQKPEREVAMREVNATEPEDESKYEVLEDKEHSFSKGPDNTMTPQIYFTDKSDPSTEQTANQEASQ